MQKKPKKKRTSVENLMRCDDIVCEFAPGTFNLLDRVLNLKILVVVHLN